MFHFICIIVFRPCANLLFCMVLLYLTEYHTAIKKFLKRDDWYMWANMQKGGITLPMFTSLDAYWPGILV